MFGIVVDCQIGELFDNLVPYYVWVIKLLCRTWFIWIVLFDPNTNNNWISDYPSLKKKIKTLDGKSSFHLIDHCKGNKQQP